jgi:hypothetical protein
MAFEELGEVFAYRKAIIHNNLENVKRLSRVQTSLINDSVARVGVPGGESARHEIRDLLIRMHSDIRELQEDTDNAIELLKRTRG